MIRFIIALDRNYIARTRCFSKLADVLEGSTPEESPGVCEFTVFFYYTPLRTQRQIKLEGYKKVPSSLLNLVHNNPRIQGL